MKIVITLLITSFCLSSLAESRMWKLDNGESVEGEFVTRSGGEVVLKIPRGTNTKIDFNLFSQEDQHFIKLESPPRLDISFSKSTTKRTFPFTIANAQTPDAWYYIFRCKIKQASPIKYDSELTVEMFSFAREMNGDKRILIDYQKQAVHLMDGPKSEVELSSDKVQTLQFGMRGKNRGEEFDGYLITVTDVRGEIIAYKASRDIYLGMLENLRNLPVGKFFDDEGLRCWPTRPERMY